MSEQRIKEALVNIGFEDKGRYLEKDHLRIKITENTILEDVFKELIHFGSIQKLWEIQRVLQIGMG